MTEDQEPQDGEPQDGTGAEAAAEGDSAAQRVIAAFGGIRPMANKLGAAVSTVQGWKERDVIPPGRQGEIREAAERHGIELSQDDLAAALRSDGLAVRRTSQLDLDAETLHAVIRDGRLVRLGDDLAYLPEQIDEITRRLSEMEDGFTVADFRDVMGMSRRQAVPVLEWLDAQGWTSRRGDVRNVRRTARRRPSPGPDDAPSL